MPPSKAEKIDQNCCYPCPCRRPGELAPIALTEALGCKLCQQIFVVKPDGYTLEQLVSYPYRQTWRWNGKQWLLARRPLFPIYWFLVLSVFVVVIIFLIYVFRPVTLGTHSLLWLVATLGFLILISMLQALFSSRR
jgi:hypothetical protein